MDGDEINQAEELILLLRCSSLILKNNFELDIYKKE